MTDTPAPHPQSLSDLAHRTEGDPMAIGAVDAPIVMLEWSDPRCPFCAAFGRDTLPDLVEEYVETGKVRIEFRDVVLFGEDSLSAAVAARAAGAQGRYLPFMTALYAAAPESGHPALPREKLLAFATEAGVPDLEKFTADLDDPALQQEVVAATHEAQQLGVSSVPFFLVHDTAVAGAQPLEVFTSLIDEKLAAVGA